MDIDPKDLKIDSFRTPGPQSWISIPDFGIRITHLPTGIFVECSSERSQHRNKVKAFDMLKKKLLEGHK